jgi:hypothetical protein
MSLRIGSSAQRQYQKEFSKIIKEDVDSQKGDNINLKPVNKQDKKLFTLKNIVVSPKNHVAFSSSSRHLNLPNKPD